jgi:phosphatidylglycerol lysyltransferase
MDTVLRTLRQSTSVRTSVSPVGRRIALAVLVMHVAVFFLSRQLAELDVAAMIVSFQAIPVTGWIMAALATMGSFWAVGRYDRVVHMATGTGVRPGRAGRAGILAIALSQTIGLGAVTGSLIRWRLLPELGAKGAAKLSVTVALSFLFAIAPLLALVILSGGPEVEAMRPFAFAVLALSFAAVLFILWPPGFAARWPRPSRAAMTRILGLVIIDVGGAALTLYALLPHATMPFADFLPIYALALMAGLAAGTPAGAGAFELTLLALMPLGEEVLVAAILGYRIVYYLIPALLAALMLAALELAPRGEVLLRHSLGLRRKAVDFDRAEARLAELGQRFLLPVGSSALLTARASSSLVGIGPALDFKVTPAETLTALRAEARHQLLSPSLYKCDSKVALSARNVGWKVLRIADEALLDPLRFDSASPACRQLRRKLRKAEEAGIVIRPARAQDLAECLWIAAVWDEAHGGERGFSMGGVDGLLHGLGPVFVATRAVDGPNGDILAFVSFLAGKREWSLDLMRHGNDLPDGTMYALVHAAIVAAKAQRISRLSLAAVPSGLTHLRRCPNRLRTWFERQSGAGGLRQFKSAFAPRYEPRYLAAPSGLALGLAGLAILRQITAPPHLPPHDCQMRSNLSSHWPNPPAESAPT